MCLFLFSWCQQLYEPRVTKTELLIIALMADTKRFALHHPESTNMQTQQGTAQGSLLPSPLRQHGAHLAHTRQEALDPCSSPHKASVSLPMNEDISDSSWKVEVKDNLVWVPTRCFIIHIFHDLSEDSPKQLLGC